MLSSLIIVGFSKTEIIKREINQGKFKTKMNLGGKMAELVHLL